jgi:hypothetical protein
MTQATVRSWDEHSGGSAFLADGSVVTLPPECLRGSAFRFVRPGQRVQLETDARGNVLRLSLP